ncbi:SPOR domain-containing protein [Thalassotalea maritima]|uniref:SPOR domain-containing protein n=1 Tax=Thalassotalea maritima TaxID=3242416 RepID=UPI003527DB31
MAQKRGAAKNTRKAAQAKKSSQATHSTVGSGKKALLAIVILIGGFAFALKWLTDNAPQLSDTTNEQQQISDKSANDSNTSKETWRFMEDLPNKDVAVETYQIEQMGPYAMQCGSFRQQRQAEQLKATIAFSGFSSEVRTSESANGVWYQVILGPFTKKREAEKTKHALRSNDINSCLIKPWA